MDTLWDETRTEHGVRSFSWQTDEIQCGTGQFRWYMRVKFASTPNTTYFKAGDVFFLT